MLKWRIQKLWMPLSSPDMRNLYHGKVFVECSMSSWAGTCPGCMTVADSKRSLLQKAIPRADEAVLSSTAVQDGISELSGKVVLSERNAHLQCHLFTVSHVNCSGKTSLFLCKLN